jgi:dipeptidyl aminopeptidase/acylaminoacyl peptidase
LFFSYERLYFIYMTDSHQQPLLILEHQDLILGTRICFFDEETKEKVRPHVSEEQFVEAQGYSDQVDVSMFRYQSNGHEVVGYISAPKNRAGKLPCIIYNRGGTGDFGAIKLYHLFAILGRMASWGFVVIASQYSGNMTGEGKDEYGGSEIEDVLILRDILRCCPNADTNRIGMFGVSRGAMMAYQALTMVDWIRAVVAIAGPTNLKRLGAWRPKMKTVFEHAFGGSEEGLRKRSAVFWTERFAHVPLLIMHGTADDRVQIEDSLDLSKALKENSVPHTLKMFPGGDHGLTNDSTEKWETIKEWFDEHL